MNADGKEIRYTFDKPFNHGDKIIVPNLLKWQARSVLASLKKTALEKNEIEHVDFEKAEGLLESFLERKTKNVVSGQQAAFALCPKLSEKPFWSESDSELLAKLSEALKNNYSSIRDEYLLATEKGLQAKEIKSGEGYITPGNWKSINIGGFGNFTEVAVKNFPNTISTLEPFSQRIFACEFVIMEPDTVLPPHVDSSNLFIKCHFGLISEQGCELKVKDETKAYAEGEAIFFDQSYPHSAWNKGKKARVNLLISMVNPEISEQEKVFIDRFIAKLKMRILLLAPFIAIEYFALKLFKTK